MRFAYADPPYIGRAYYYKNHPDFAGEVDHAELVTRFSIVRIAWRTVSSENVVGGGTNPPLDGTPPGDLGITFAGPRPPADQVCPVRDKPAMQNLVEAWQAEMTGKGKDGKEGQEGQEGSDEPVEPATLDPAAVEADLVAVAGELFPADSTQDYVEAHSWSVVADNLAADQPRDLAGAEREGATQWEIRNTRGDHSYWVYVEHIASDYQELRTPPGCEPTSTTFCETLTTPSGRTAYEQVFTYDGGGSHYLWVPGDAATGRPDVSIGESVSGLTGEPEEQELIGLTELSVDEQLAALDDERLQILLPEVLPPLPSFAACAYTTDPPADCPPGLQ